MSLNIPTWLTLIRIALIPVFVLIFYLPFSWSNLVCAVVFAIAGITDWLDGYLARRWNQTSDFGAFLDPVADKLMVSTVLILLVQAYPIALIALPAMVIVGREITISALREWMAGVGEKTKVSVSKIGKVKTTAQMGALFLLIFADPVELWQIHWAGIILLYLATVLTLWSMILYLRAAWPMLHSR